MKLFPMRRAAAGLLVAAGLAFGAGTPAQAAVDLPPDLIPLPAGNISLVTDATVSTTTLRFDTTSWNGGTGPFELRAGLVDTGSGKQQVFQRVYTSDGSYYDHLAGWFEWHPLHNHFHFDDYALYTLQPVNAPGGSSRTGQKTTFCIMDNTQVNLTLPGAPQAAVYSTCGNQVQGMSVGWGDTYKAVLAGQEIDFTDNADGIYQLRIDIDPNKNIIESNKADNGSCVLLNIRKPSTVIVLNSSGNCDTVVSITPNTASAGTTVQVTITGYAFAAGMGVTFSGGTGPRPVASNVQLVSDTNGLDTLTATVTVPYKRQLGKKPVWDVLVGNGNVLPRGFTVTP